MSASHRKFRALIYAYVDEGTAGEMASAYLLQSSGQADEAWWCSRGMPTGLEVTTAMAPEHRVDAVLGFSAYAPVDDHSAVIVDGVSYLVRAILARDYGRDDLQVLAERAQETLVTRTGRARVSQVALEVMVAA